MLNIPKEVKDLFKKDSVRKNIRIHFPNGERADITNSNLIAESFSFTESVMSQSEFRFGLCEASMVEFECFGVENIKGYEIEVSHEIDISSLGEEFIDTYGMTSDDVAFPFFRVPYGKFTVDEALRQADMVRRKVTAYGKMLDSLEPNKIELAKQLLNFKSKYNYTIDLLKYLYSNVPANSVIPNATYTSIGIDAIYNGISGVQSVRFRAKTCSTFSIENDSLLKVTFGKRLKTFDEAFDEILEYAQEKYPYFYEELISNKGKIKYDLEPYLKMAGIRTYKIKDEKDTYIYAGFPDGTSSLGITTSIEIYSESSQVTRISVDLFEKGTTKIELVDIDAPKITVSYPLKKDGSYYYIKDIPYNTFPQLIEEAIELQGKFGKVDRYGNFQMISVNQNFGLTPSKTLVPSKTLAPRGIRGEVFRKGNYSSLWYDDFKTKPYDRVSVSYKNADGEEIYAEHLIVDIESDTYNASDYQAYSLSENTLIQNGTFTEAQIAEILQTVAKSLIGLQYMPFEMDSIGLPYLESGDAVIAETNEGSFQTLILDRRIDGIQNLTDNLNAN